MSVPLWTLDDIAAATSAILDLPRHATGATPPRRLDIGGVSIDTRTLEHGDLFVALKDIRDGHEFVTFAFEKQAGAALVGRNYQRQLGDGPLLRVDDPLRALERLGIAARARLSPNARVIAVTGSVGKTTTKEMLRACLAPLGKTHAADKSFNNHWGVPLTLARMPADTQYGVFEIGMNHAGEITPLSKMVRPHVAIITTVEAVHLEHFKSVEDIAQAKAEIFDGINPGGAAIIPRDNPHFAQLAARARGLGVRTVTFGLADDATVRLTGSFVRASGVSYNTVTLKGLQFSIESALAGRHMIHNALAIAAALDVVGVFPASAMAPLAKMGAPQGRGSRTTLPMDGGNALLIDESYNANPASMRAAFAALATVPRGQSPRRIAVLGDMLELGPESANLHASLADAIQANGIDLVFACGPEMKHLYEALPVEKRAKWASMSSGLTSDLLECVRGGDVVMIKGSNGSRMAPLVSALIARHIPAKSNG
jgi:UDP-N-acetylmuramoyl-tripeptide--D-alanyl-D-alanine ligase